MSDTPRTDHACTARMSGYMTGSVSADFARQLERELNRLEQRLAARREHTGTTHSENCHHWHFECALKRLDAAEKERDAAIEKFNQLKNNE